ncbi:NAD(P)H-hydrate dehydratase [Parasphingorhabdus sp. JC815]|uniref:NAD(P)H-hydrate dehydratase n=1 Tax=Parasphingorhabdus sp. JC815 TaxID=3232140 RepID=UPI003457F9F3
MLNHGQILTTKEMQAAEQMLVDDGISIIELMDKAGTGAAEYIARSAPEYPTLIFCGPGNNGGDGYIIAQTLLEKGTEVAVAASGNPTTDAAKHAKSLWKGETLNLQDAKPMRQFVDCLFGTGLTRPITGDLLDHHQRLCNGAQRRVAVDLPSGAATDTGALLNPVCAYDLTIALGAFKPAHFLHPASALMGDVVGVDIGVSAVSQIRLLEKPSINPPAYSNHKYKRGLVAVIAGAMPGAAKLAALAAQRSGAGYVKIFAQTGFSPPNHSIVTEYHCDLEQLRKQLSDERIDIILIGPGLGRDEQASKILNIVLNSEKPLLLDADALIILEKNTAKRLKHHSHPVIITPHAGEFMAVSSATQGSKIDLTVQLAAKSGAIIVHKGPDSVIANPKGDVTLVPPSSSWLSTAGTGDVLAGIIAARFAGHKNPYLAANQGQWLHSRAGKLAAPAFSPEILIDHIPKALQECL